MNTTDDQDFRKRMGRIEALIASIERCGDPATRSDAQELVSALMDLHGAGLTAMLERIAGAGAPGLAIIDALASDDLVSSLLLLYGLHPLELETRVERALESVRPYLHSHKGDVALLGVAEGVVRLRMQGSCHGCPSSALTLKNAIEEAIIAAAPDATSIEVEGVTEHPEPPLHGFVPVEQMLGRR